MNLPDAVLYQTLDSLNLDSHRPKRDCVICFNESLFKNDEKCFLFHLKSSFRSQDI